MCCMRAALSLDGLLMGGMALRVYVLDYSDSESSVKGNGKSKELNATAASSSSSSLSSGLLNYNLEPYIETEGEQEAKSPHGMWSVEVRGILDNADLRDEDEVQEILQDFLTICLNHQCVPKTMWISVITSTPDTAIDADAVIAHNENLVEADGDGCYTILRMNSLWQAVNTVNALHNQIIGGESLEAYLCDTMQSLLITSNYTIAVRVKDFFQREVLHDEDELEETLASLRPFLPIDCSDLAIDVDIREKPGTNRDDENNCAVLIYCGAMELAVKVLRALNGLCFGGEELKADVVAISDETISYTVVGDACEGFVLVRGFFCDKDLEEADGLLSEEFIEGKHDLMSLIRKGISPEDNATFLCKSLRVYRRGMLCDSKAQRDVDETGALFCISFEEAQIAERAMLELDGFRLGGASMRCSTNNLLLRGMKDILHCVSVIVNEVMTAALPIPSAARKPAPRLPKASLISHTDKSTGDAPHIPLLVETMNIPRANDDINQLVKDLLSALSAFQERALVKDAVKAKANPRFVMGLKQVTNGVKSGRARLVLLANDPESSEALDAKIVNLIEKAASKLDPKDDEPIPVLVSLSRRQLAKAIGSKMRQAAIAVYNPDGSYAEFKKIVAFIRNFASS